MNQNHEYCDPVISDWKDEVANLLIKLGRAAKLIDVGRCIKRPDKLKSKSISKLLKDDPNFEINRIYCDDNVSPGNCHWYDEIKYVGDFANSSVNHSLFSQGFSPRSISDMDYPPYASSLFHFDLSTGNLLNPFTPCSKEAAALLGRQSSVSIANSLRIWKKNIKYFISMTQNQFPQTFASGVGIDVIAKSVKMPRNLDPIVHEIKSVLRSATGEFVLNVAQDHLGVKTVLVQLAPPVQGQAQDRHVLEIVQPLAAPKVVPTPAVLQIFPKLVVSAPQDMLPEDVSLWILEDWFRTVFVNQNPLLIDLFEGSIL